MSEHVLNLYKPFARAEYQIFWKSELSYSPRELLYTRSHEQNNHWRMKIEPSFSSQVREETGNKVPSPKLELSCGADQDMPKNILA